ncbi:DNA polymerase I-like protein with 3'-5' exonuclease and polymerase domains [Desulfitispora alkaliphila]|uniref:DNA polymerase n=1 Tax=Desulfitispora alkaliphila TaxID=622674 RepID=UPI003D1F27BC
MANYIYVTKDETLKKSIEKYSDSEVIGVDIETMGKDPLCPRKGEIRLLQIAVEKSPVMIVDWTKISDEGKQVVKEFLERPTVKVFHNAKFDLKFLFNEGINLQEYIFDTYLAAGVLTLGRKNPKLSLESLVEKHLKIKLDKEEQKSNWARDPLTDEQLKYAAIDASVLLPLRQKLTAELENSDLKETAKLEFETIPAIVQMELNGVGVDKEKLALLKENLQQEKEACLDSLRAHFPQDINFNSPNQLLQALGEKGIKITSTKHEELSQIAPRYEEVSLILKHKEIEKQLQFAKKIPECVDVSTSKIYSNYFQLGAATGRLSCTDFNLQQVPNRREFRDCFVPDKGNVLVVADYSQMQIRIAAEISKDYEMIEAYQRGDDLHKLTASLISGKSVDEVTKEMRTAAKALNFGMLFGMGAAGLVKYAWSSYNVKLTEQEASEFIEKFFKKYSGLKHWQKKEGRKKTKESRTLGNRRRLFDEEARYTQLVNNPIQGSESDILKKVLSFLPTIFNGTSAKIIACVHDEIIIECEEAEAEKIAVMLQVAMEKVGEKYLKEVPVVAEAIITTSWAEK